ncbi:MAG: GGDEF domain-containing protein [Pseudomonadota bacterium]|nr:GGDEF domain-containing protein [Pseudomonadota bacterium]
MKRRRADLILLVLFLFTAIGLAWNQFGMNRRLVLDGTSNVMVRAIDDSSSGGKTTSSIHREGNKLVMNCEIRAGYAWPYCNLVFELGRPPAGVDLSAFDEVAVQVDSQGPEAEQQVRLFLLNFNSAYSDPTQPSSAKVQELVYGPTAHPDLSAKLSQFTVSSWWSTSHVVGVEHAGTEFDNVVAMQVATGGNVTPGMHVITVDRIEFTGKLVPPATFRLWVIAAWLMAGVAYIAFYAFSARKALEATRHGKATLERLNAELRAETDNLKQVAKRDPLTGALNRHGLRDELSKAAERGDVQFFPLSIVFVDIDHFKRINDLHGHDVGDRVIKEISDVISSAIQRDDILARWGGEEFLLIFPGTAPTDARAIAERLRRAIAGRPWPDGLQVTGSFGVSEATAGEDLVDGIKRADEAMYLAKSNGRDRVELNLGGPNHVSLPSLDEEISDFELSGSTSHFDDNR